MRYGHRALRRKFAVLCFALLLLADVVPSFAEREAEDEAAIHAETDFLSAESGDPLADERQKQSTQGGEP